MARLPVGPSRGRFVLEHIAVDLNVLLEIRGHVLFRKDRGHRALGLARTAINALVGMDVELIGSFIDAVYRAYIDAGAVLRILAGFSYDVGHFVPDRAAATPAL
jgi:hypothetical protein